jgi:hypothetical protein
MLATASAMAVADMAIDTADLEAEDLASPRLLKVFTVI